MCVGYIPTMISFRLQSQPMQPHYTYENISKYISKANYAALNPRNYFRQKINYYKFNIPIRFSATGQGQPVTFG